jgi:hypothetical protein
MAKVKSAVTAAKEKHSFSELNDLLSAFSPDGAIMDDNIYARIDEWIPTGSYILNAAMSGSLFGGMPNRRSLMFAGEEGCLQKDETIEIYRLKSNITQRHETIQF